MYNPFYRTIILVALFVSIIVGPPAAYELLAQPASHTTPHSTPPDLSYTIYLRNIHFDPLVDEPSLPPGLQSSPSGDALTTYLVQFRGPVRSEWKAATTTAGATLYDYIPDHTFIARMDGTTAAQVRQLEHVRWVGLYHPGYRLSQAVATPARIAEVDGDDTPAAPLLLTAQTLPDASMPLLIAHIHALGGTVQEYVTTAIAGYLRVQLPRAQLASLAALDSITWVEPYRKGVRMNDVARQITHADSLSQEHGLNGEGQVVAIADDGLDTGNTATLHPDLRGRLLKAYCLGRPEPCNWSDGYGHGTHVAGSAVGDGTLSAGTYQGMAPAAQLVFQSLVDNQGELGGIPQDVGELMRQAYADGARIHSNSWGFATGQTATGQDEYGGYDTRSQQVDLAAWQQKDMLVLFSAGNTARDHDGDGVVDADSIVSPGTAKNVITVGASESQRASIEATWGERRFAEPVSSDLKADNPGGMAASSGRGPTDDGRIKPDLVAPGTAIVSLRTRQHLFTDTLEHDTSGYTQQLPVTTEITSPWLVTTGNAHSGSHAWQQQVQGTHAATTTTVLFTPPVDVQESAGFFDVLLWHRYGIQGDNQPVMIVRGPVQGSDQGSDDVVWLPPVPLLDEPGTQESYTLLRADSLDVYARLVQANIDLTRVQVGFGIHSPSGTYSSTWTIDDIRIEGYKEFLLSEVGLAEPGSQQDESYAIGSGTSRATPLVAGGAALVREWLTTSQQVDTPGSALIRALLLNGAADMSPGQYGTAAQQEIPASRPNNVTGWGRLDLRETLASSESRTTWFTEHDTGLSTGTFITYRLMVGESMLPGDVNIPFYITLVWTDYPGTPAAGKAMVNDLDLEVYAPDGTRYRGNEGVYPAGHTCLRNGFDACNTAESIFIPVGLNGSYRVIVRGVSVPQGTTQPFALAVSGNDVSGSVAELVTFYLPLVQ
jgi:subtilisin family serine protease